MSDAPQTDDKTDRIRKDGLALRRGFLKGTGTVMTSGTLGSVLAERGLAVSTEPKHLEATTPKTHDTTHEPGAVFPQAVASGGPTTTGVLLWTRIAPAAYRENQPLTVEVAHDEDFTDRVYRGIVPANRIAPEHDFTVKVDLDGKLEPDRTYRYRFVYDGVESQHGRCRTLPAADARPESVRFAVLTCQDYQNGYYGAYSHVAEEDVDFLVHLGDFIYESANGQYKAPGARDYPGRTLTLPSGESLAHSLDDFRYLHRTYRSDRFLQKGLRRHTLIVGWDDHEVANNRYWDYETESPVLPPHADGSDPDAATRITANGIQAWVEYLPARVGYNQEAEDLQERFTLRRAFRFGDLTSLVFTDERLFRDAPPAQTGGDDDAPDRTMLGRDQLAWFLDAVETTNTTWKVWANEVLTMALKIGDTEGNVYLNKDAWDGYQHERRTIMGELEQADIENFITVTGDFHSYLAGYQLTDYEGLFDSSIDVIEAQDKVGVELMTPAITSVNLEELAAGTDSLAHDEITDAAVTSQNPHVEFFDSTEWGYSVVEFTPDGCTYTAYSVDKTINSADAEKRLMKVIRVPEGRVEIQEGTDRLS